MTREFRPMLAATATDLASLTYPLYVSPKLDGIRSVVRNGKLISRNGKLIPNRYIQSLLGNSGYEGLDGELIVGSPTDADVFNTTSSGVMRHDGSPDFSFLVFDDCSLPERFYADRYTQLTSRLAATTRILQPVVQMIVHSAGAAAEAEDHFVNMGYEGMMLRSLDAAYKYGRGTLKKQDLLKFKRFEDAEAVVIGFEEEMQNTNAAVLDELGRTARSNVKEGMVGKDRLGALVVKGVGGRFDGVTFRIGSGFTAAQREDFWLIRDTLMGALVTYKFFPIGCLNAPRFPIFKGFRHRNDMS